MPVGITIQGVRLRVFLTGANGWIGLESSKIDALAQEDRNDIDAFGEALVGSDRPLIVTSGVFMTPPGEVVR